MCLFLSSYLPLFQLHPELSAVPEQHDSGGLHDGAGCGVPAGDWRSPRPQITVPRRLPGNRRKRQAEAEESRRAGWRVGVAIVCKHLVSLNWCQYQKPKDFKHVMHLFFFTLYVLVKNFRPWFDKLNDWRLYRICHNHTFRCCGARAVLMFRLVASETPANQLAISGFWSCAISGWKTMNV